MNSSTVEYSAYDAEETLKIRSDSAGASLSMGDAGGMNSLPKHKRFQETGIVAAFLSFTGILALASVLTAAGAMIMEASTFMYIVFSFPIILAPVILYQRSKLERNPSKS
jgi:hypothetical protein